MSNDPYQRYHVVKYFYLIPLLTNLSIKFWIGKFWYKLKWISVCYLEVYWCPWFPVSICRMVDGLCIITERRVCGCDLSTAGLPLELCNLDDPDEFRNLRCLGCNRESHIGLPLSVQICTNF